MQLDDSGGFAGPGEALEPINHPVRSRVPILPGAMGPEDTAPAAELRSVEIPGELAS